MVGLRIIAFAEVHGPDLGIDVRLLLSRDAILRVNSFVSPDAAPSLHWNPGIDGTLSKLSYFAERDKETEELGRVV